MAKGKDIKGMLGKKGPTELRQAVSKVNILQCQGAAASS